MFDLGGVIVRWVGLDALASLSGLSREAVIEKLDGSDTFRAFERGHCSSSDFLKNAIDIFELNIEPGAFSPLWNSWVEAAYDGAYEKLDQLKSSFTVACLSNTNQLHWDYLENRDHISSHFDVALASHHIHAAKPDLECYNLALKHIGAKAEDVWFFDDTLVNVEAARRCGITSYHVDRNIGIMPLLAELGL